MARPNPNRNRGRYRISITERIERRERFLPLRATIAITILKKAEDGSQRDGGVDVPVVASHTFTLAWSV